MLINKVLSFFLSSLVILAFSAPGFAQRAAGSIAGRVTDVSGATVPGAEVSIRNLDTGIERTTITNDTGSYSVAALHAGRYTITIKKNGFTAYTVSEFVLQVDQQATANALLTVGSVANTVTVQGSPTAINTRVGPLPCPGLGTK